MGLPDVIGAIDGTDIEVKGPKVSRMIYHVLYCLQNFCQLKKYFVFLCRNILNFTSTERNDLTSLSKLFVILSLVLQTVLLVLQVLLAICEFSEIQMYGMQFKKIDEPFSLIRNL